MGLKAPGNYLDQFGSNQMPVLLSEKSKPPNSMISGFVDPGEPVFMDFNIPKYLKTYKKIWQHFGFIFINLMIKLVDLLETIRTVSVFVCLFSLLLFVCVFF